MATKSKNGNARKGARLRERSLWYALHPGWHPNPEKSGIPAPALKRKRHRAPSKAAIGELRDKAWVARRAAEMRANPTPAEIKLQASLERWNFRGFRFQRPFGPYVPDFLHARLRLVIEVDGAHHWYDREQRDHDERRTQYLGGHGFRVLRFSNREVLNHGESVKRAIADAIKVAKAPRAVEGLRAVGTDVAVATR